MRHGLGAMVVAVILGLGVPTANAAPLVFFGENLSPGGTLSGAPVTAQAAFLAGLVGVGIETFEGQAGATAPLPVSFPGSGGAITATLSGSGGVCATSSGNVGSIGCNGFGRFPTSGNSWFHTTAPGFTVSFSAPIAAFGFYGTDIGDFSGQLSATTAGGGVVNLVVPHTLGAPNGSLLFWGFIDANTTYTSITFNASSGSDVFGFDDLIVGDLGQVRPVPEPSALLMLGSGLAVAALYRRRRA